MTRRRRRSGRTGLALGLWGVVLALVIVRAVLGDLGWLAATAIVAAGAYRLGQDRPRTRTGRVLPARPSRDPALAADRAQARHDEAGYRQVAARTRDTAAGPALRDPEYDPPPF